MLCGVVLCSVVLCGVVLCSGVWCGAVLGCVVLNGLRPSTSSIVLPSSVGQLRFSIDDFP